MINSVDDNCKGVKIKKRGNDNVKNKIKEVKDDGDKETMVERDIRKAGMKENGLIID